MPSNDVSKARNAQAGAPCFLLDLPGEIRNRIYEYLLDDFDFHHTSISLYNDPRNDESTIKLLRLNVSQLCNTIRAEFRPMWLKRLKLSRTRLRFMHDAFPARLGGACMKTLAKYCKIMGTVHLDLVVHVNEMLALLQVKARQPAVSFVTHSTSGSTQYLEIVLKSDNVAWDLLVQQDSVSSVDVMVGPDLVKVIISLEDEFVDEERAISSLQNAGLTRKDATEAALMGIRSGLQTWIENEYGDVFRWVDDPT